MRRSSGAFFSLLLFAGPAFAQEDPAPSDQRLDQLEEEIETREEELSRQEAEYQRLIAEQDALRRRSIDIVEQVQSSEARLIEIEDRITALRADEAPLLEDLNVRRAALTDILAALQSVERNKPPALLVRPDDAVGAARTAMLLGAVVPELEEQVTGLHAQLTELTNLRASIEAEQQSLIAASARLDAEQATLDRLLAERERVAASIAQAVASEREALAAFAAEAEDLRGLIGRLSRRFSAAFPMLRPDPNAPPPPTFADRFIEAVGTLRLPVVGRPVGGFGDELDGGTHSQGIAIQTRPGAPVVAPFDSEIVFAAPYRGYGELLILSPGDGYLILLSGLGRIDGVVGQQLLAGEPVGTMGTETLAPNVQRWAARGEAVPDQPVLYLEMREGGSPIDPLPWFREDQWRQDGS